jgi:uncharacterized oligopeptide transporter (OPT) family protein
MEQEWRRRRKHRRPSADLEPAMAYRRDGVACSCVHQEEPAAASLDGDTEAGARGGGRVPPWWDQLTLRGLAASLAVGTMYCVIVMKLNLTTGLVPTLNVSSALIAFAILRCWTQALSRLGIATRPFTRQENSVVQTCAVACYSIAVGGRLLFSLPVITRSFRPGLFLTFMSFAGGFSSYLLALNKKTYELAGEETEGNSPGSYKEPGVWIIGFLLMVSFVGIFSLVPLRKVRP